MDEQVGHAEHRVARVLAHPHVHHRAVLLRHHAVQRQRQRHPLVRLDAAVVVRIEVRQAVCLGERVLLEVEARRVDVRAEDVHALGKRPRAEMRQDERLAMRERPHLVARFERAPFAHRLGEAAVAARLGLRDRRGGALALGFVLADEIDVVGGKPLKRLEVGRAVALPCHFMFHARSFRSQAAPLRASHAHAARRPSVRSRLLCRIFRPAGAPVCRKATRRKPGRRALASTAARHSDAPLRAMQGRRPFRGTLSQAPFSTPHPPSSQRARTRKRNFATTAA